MIKDDLEFFRRWFSDFCRSFYSDNADNETMLAESVALFHDVGRFPQYAKYKTFRDSISVNHGLLGAETLVENRVLQNLSEDEQELVIESVKFHNAFSVPKKERVDINMYIKL